MKTETQCERGVHLQPLIAFGCSRVQSGFRKGMGDVLEVPDSAERRNTDARERGCEKMSSWLSRLFVMLILSTVVGLLSILTNTTFADDTTSGDTTSDDTTSDAVMAGYLLAPNEKVPEKYNAGFSMYVAAWPLLDKYPGRQFQTGLFGTWMFPSQKIKPKEKFYTDIEGGLGWWRDTRFATETPKFIMGGVALNFSEWANGPGAGKGRGWDEPKGKYGIAQLSPNILWPPDGLNLRQGTSGELFGYGYLPLPLASRKTTTQGKAISTGDQCWTLFLNTQNFKGPVAFFTPYFWSRASVNQPKYEGMFLDTRPSNPNRHLQMETQFVPARHATTTSGDQFARVAPVYYPVDSNGDTVAVHRVMSYERAALWNHVERWLAGGDPANTTIDTAAAVVHQFTGKGSATWRIYQPSTPKEDRGSVDWKSFATPMAIDQETFGYRWNQNWVTNVENSTNEIRRVVRLPQYYQRTSQVNGKAKWTAVKEPDVPAELNLQESTFVPPARKNVDPYVTPNQPGSCWKTPGPTAGPFQAYPGDGSVVTYYWYRFADQPALLNADLTDEQREAMQQRVEKLHRHWTRDREYLPPPRRGQLAALDSALIVTPPEGLEVGYVPIATRQATKPESH